MVRSALIWLAGTAVCATTILAPDAAVAGEKEKVLAQAVAEYLIAARAVIADNQALINDPPKGGRGFTPEFYESKVRAEFLKSSKIDIKQLKPSTTDIFASSLTALHQSAMDVATEFQARLNKPEAGFRGIHPAVFGARVGQKLYTRSDIQLKQTSLKYRATYNKPDEFESRVLKQFEAAPRAQPYFEEVAAGGKRAARYLAPLYITKSCLSCHGDPAGELDVTGRAKEGYKEGSLRGAVSVIVPVR